MALGLASLFPGHEMQQVHGWFAHNMQQAAQEEEEEKNFVSFLRGDVYHNFQQACNLLCEKEDEHGMIVHVYTHRLVYRLFYSSQDDDPKKSSSVYKLVGTVRTLLCKLPVHAATRGKLAALEAAVMNHPMQWCMALLEDQYAPMETCSYITLVNWNGRRRTMQSVDLQHELWQQTQESLGCTALTLASQHPSVDGLLSKEECSIGWFVENVGILLSRHATPLGTVDICLGHMTLPGQGLNALVYFTDHSPALGRMLLDMQLLWARSFHVHRAYVTAGEEGEDKEGEEEKDTRRRDWKKL